MNIATQVATTSESNFVASRSLRAWNKLNRCCAFVLKLLLLNLTFSASHPTFSAPVKSELNGSNNKFLEADRFQSLNAF